TAGGCPREPETRREVRLVPCHQRTRRAVLARYVERSRRIVEVALAVVCFHDRRKVIVTHAKIQGEVLVNFPVVLYEEGRHMLAVTQLDYCGNSGADRQAEEHVCERASSGTV